MRAHLSVVQGRLLRAVREALGDDDSHPEWDDDTNGLLLSVLDFEASPWASLTFSGLRHNMELRLSGGRHAISEAIEKLEFRLAEGEMPLPGYFLVEAEVSDKKWETRSNGHISLCFRVCALTIEE